MQPSTKMVLIKIEVSEPNIEPYYSERTFECLCIINQLTLIWSIFGLP